MVDRFDKKKIRKCLVILLLIVIIENDPILKSSVKISCPLTVSISLGKYTKIS